MKPKIIFIYLFLLALCIKGNAKPHINNDSICGDSIIEFSKKHIGTKYKYASVNPEKGFDCSGFVYYVFNHFQKTVPRSSIEYKNAGTTIHPDSFKVGDIIVFRGTNANNRNPGHVGIIISNYGNELTFIHSSSNKKHSGIKVSSFNDSPYYRKRFIKIVRLMPVY